MIHILLCTSLSRQIVPNLRIESLVQTSCQDISVCLISVPLHCMAVHGRNPTLAGLTNKLVWCADGLCQQSSPSGHLLPLLGCEQDQPDTKVEGQHTCQHSASKGCPRPWHHSITYPIWVSYIL